MRKSVRGIIATLLVFVLAVGTGSAQTPRTEMKLTIEEAIELGLANDVAYRLAALDVQIAQVRLEQAEAGNLMQPSPTLLYQAQVGLELAERSMLLAERSLVLQIAQDYYTLLRLENILAVLDEAIRLGERQLAVAESRFAAGAATRLDVMTAETTLASHRADRAQAEANKMLAETKFKQSLGLGAEVQLVLDDAVIQQALPEMSLDKALEIGLANRIELVQAAAGVSIAEKELELKTNDYTPLLERRLAEVELERARTVFEQATQGISLDIQNAYHTMHDAFKRMELAALELAKAEEQYRVVQALFDAGMATDVEILQAQTGLTQARSGQVNAIFDFNIARMQFFHAIGQGPQGLLDGGE